MINTSYYQEGTAKLALPTLLMASQHTSGHEPTNFVISLPKFRHCYALQSVHLIPYPIQCERSGTSWCTLSGAVVYA